MKILAFWDLFGRIWRKWFQKELPKLKEKYNPDFIIVNVENIASWRWPISKLVVEMEELWVDVMTGWDHIYDNHKDIMPFLEKDDCSLLRPANFYESDLFTTPGKWYKIVEKNGKKLLVIHLIWEVFTKFNIYNPFLKVDEILKEVSGEKFDAVVVDFHKEVSSEGYWMGMFLDGRISLLFGTHTHVQSNDEMILQKWTWFISDAWMTGPLYSVIWADYGSVEKRFLSWILKWKIDQDLWKDYVVSWVFAEINDYKCSQIEKIRIRGKLV